MIPKKYTSVLLHASLISLPLVFCVAEAHESHETRMQHLESELDQVPSTSIAETVELVLLRADLHRRQRDWDAALHDYQHVADVQPENVNMMLGRAQLHLDQHQYAQAIFWSTRILRLQSTHVLADLNYARALAGIGHIDTASLVFERAIDRLDKPRPEHYIEQAQLLLEATDNPDFERSAIAILDMGAEALGHPVSLHDRAYEVERKSGQLDAALSRIDSVLARNSSLLNWRLRRGELLMELGRAAEALDEMHCLTAQLQKLPEQRRLSNAFQDMTQRSQGLVARAININTVTVNPSEVAQEPENEKHNDSTIEYFQTCAQTG